MVENRTFQTIKKTQFKVEGIGTEKKGDKNHVRIF